MDLPRAPGTSAFGRAVTLRGDGVVDEADRLFGVPPLGPATPVIAGADVGAERSARAFAIARATSLLTAPCRASSSVGTPSSRSLRSLE